MTFFYWNKNFEIGVPAIDAQHRRLVDLINVIATAVTEKAALPDLRALFSQLTEYAATHFHDEELVMTASQLPQAEKEAHRNEHQAFIDKANEMAAQLNLEQAEIAEQILEFLTIWLISHILGSDKKIAQALQSNVAAQVVSQPLFHISPVERTLLVALTETERRFRMIADHSPVLMWVADAHGERGFFNRSWKEFVGKEDWHHCLHPQDLPDYLELIQHLQDNPEPGEAEFRLRRQDGQYRWFLEKILPRIDTNGVFMGLIGSAIDISAIKEAETRLSQANEDLESEVASRTEQLEQLMLTDQLTGVGNRRLMIKALTDETTRAQRYQRPYSLIFFDLDHFKRINDAYGHASGDAVLVAVAGSLKAALRDCDLLGRIGGEEFVVLLPETGIDNALQAAQRMRADIEQLRIVQIEENITISAGVAEWRDGESGEQLLDRADHALYRAKESGRNRCLADPGA